MNDLSKLFLNVSDGDTVTLNENGVYSISPEDSFVLENLFFSNTANQSENPNGTRFCGIYLENKNNITIDGNGAVILIHGIMTPFIFKKCRNVMLKNLTFDHYRPTMSEMTVILSQPGRAVVRINDEYIYKIKDNDLIWQSENKNNGEKYWEIKYKGPGVLTNSYNLETGIIDDMIAGKNDSWGGFPDIEKITQLQKGVLKLEFKDKDKKIPVNTVAQTRSIKRLQTGGAIDECENIVLENLRIMSMNGFGILAQNSKDLTYINLDCTPKQGRTIVSDADFFHFSGCSGTVNVIGCKAKGAHDDIINIHGTHLKIISLDSENNSVLLRYSHAESWGFNPYYPGDEIEFVSGNCLTSYHKTTVKSLKKINNTDFLVFLNSLPEKEPKDNDVIENVTRTAALNVFNNQFSCIPSRAVLCTTRKDVHIENNLFMNMGAPVLCVADDANFWFESGKSGRIYFENNIVINCSVREENSGSDVIRYEPVVMDKEFNQPVHNFLSVKNNKFYNYFSDRYTINLNYLNEAEIKNNYSNVSLVTKKGKGCVKVSV
ncbi:MAG: hypothetical protein K6B52_05785 [Clostridiales bacterium]|nr:hypothetical protein [Clostridiales bacterium]